MNREQRRYEERAKKRASKVAKLKANAYRNSNRPMLHEVQMVFGPAEAFLDELATGWVSCVATGEPVFKECDGNLYEAIPAMRGLVDAMERICRHYAVDLDFSPAVKLCNKLEASMPVMPENVAAARAVFDLAKAYYRKMDAYVVRGLVNTELLAYEFEKRGMTA